MAEVKSEVVIRVRELVVGFDGTTVLDHMSLDVFRGEILGFVGGSGAGKSVLMRTILGLAPVREGSIEVFGLDLAKASEPNVAPPSGVGAFCSSRGHYFPHSASAKTSNFPCENTLTCRIGCSTKWPWRNLRWSASPPMSPTSSRPSYLGA